MHTLLHYLLKTKSIKLNKSKRNVLFYPLIKLLNNLVTLCFINLKAYCIRLYKLNNIAKFTKVFISVCLIVVLRWLLYQLMEGSHPTTNKNDSRFSF